MAGVLGDLANRGLQRTTDDVDTAGLVVIGALQAIQRPGGIEQRSAAAGNDAFLNGRAGGVKRVVDAILALLHFDFRSAADLDHRNAASKLGETLLQLFTVIVRRSRLDLRADLLVPALDALGVARTIDKGRVVLVDRDALGAAKHVERDAFQLDAEIFGAHLPAGPDRDVLHTGLEAIAEARSLHRRDLQAAAQLVDDQRGESQIGRAHV